MTAALDPEVKHFAKQIDCDVVGWGAGMVTILHEGDDQRVRLVNGMNALGWSAVQTQEDHDSGDSATTVDFTRRLPAKPHPAGNPIATAGIKDVTLDTSAIGVTLALIILVIAILIAGLVSVRNDPLPKQLLLWCVSAVAVVLLCVSIFRSRLSFQKISFTADRIVLVGAGRKQGGDSLPLRDILDWSHRRIYWAKGYGHLITFRMRDGRTFEIACAAKYGPRVIAEIQKRLG